jgi:hypothetical protein
MGHLGARVFSLGAVSAAAFSLQVAAARAEPRLRDVGPVSTDPAADASQVIADRGRLAYTPGNGRVRLIDERLSEVASVVEPGCMWRGFGGGAVLWSCGPAPGYPFGYSPLLELDGRQRTLLGPPRLPLGGHGESPLWWGSACASVSGPGAGASRSQRSRQTTSWLRWDDGCSSSAARR